MWVPCAAIVLERARTFNFTGNQFIDHDPGNWSDTERERGTENDQRDQWEPSEVLDIFRLCLFEVEVSPQSCHCNAAEQMGQEVQCPTTHSFGHNSGWYTANGLFTSVAKFPKSFSKS